jgi:hypothetical protein
VLGRGLQADLVDGLLVAVADNLLDAVDVLAVAVDLVPPADEVEADVVHSRSVRKQRETEDGRDGAAEEAVVLEQGRHRRGRPGHDAEGSRG